jgi:hypothetical protein
MNWKFWKKEQPKYKLTRDSKGNYHIYYSDEYTNEYETLIVESTDELLIRTLYVQLSQQVDLAEEIKKHITDSMPKGYVDRITIGGDHTFISEPYIKSTIPTVEDIKNIIEDPNIFYAVQGNYPNIVISKYEKVAEDSFNYCLRQEEGNLALLQKSICFNKKSDAIEYQNELIQKAIQEQFKSKKK